MAGPYYVDVAVGNDANAGTSEGSGNAWASLEKLFDTIAAGEIGYVKASGSYTAQDGANDCVGQVTTAGTAAAPITIEGYTTTVGDNGQVTVDANTGGWTNAIAGTLTSWYYQFKNFRFTGGSGDGFSVNGTAGDYVKFLNCRFDNNGGYGLLGDNGIVAINCTFDNNSSGGLDVDFQSAVIFCTIHSNSGNGANSANGNLTSIGSVYYGNAGNTNIRIANDVATLAIILNNSIDGDGNVTSVGIKDDNAGSFTNVIMNNILFDLNSGVEVDAAHGLEMTGIDGNLYYSNTTDRTGFAAGDNEVTGTADPFDASGSQDYAISTSSEAADAAVDAGEGTLDIGAYQAPSGGGGGNQGISQGLHTIDSGIVA